LGQNGNEQAQEVPGMFVKVLTDLVSGKSVSENLIFLRPICYCVFANVSHFHPSLLFAGEACKTGALYKALGRL